MKMSILVLVETIAVLALSVVASAFTQNLAQARDRFEVVSIRPVLAGARSGRAPLRVPLGSYCDGDAPQADPGRIALNNNLYTLITMAYGLNCLSSSVPDLVSGGPEWAKTDRWAIQAVIPEADGSPVSTEKCRSACRAWFRDPRVQGMLQNLLAERFKLSLHRETKQVPVYELTVANGGPTLQHPEDICSLPGDPKNTGPSVKPPCEIVVRNGTMASFAAGLTILDRPVIDKTEITGTFEFRLRFDPRLSQVSSSATELSDPSGPSIFAAVQNQLGLKLESAKDMVEVLVIDHAEKAPEEDRQR